ncbi:MAG: fructosamine kinase family protein [Rhodospirillales bacterium]
MRPGSEALIGRIAGSRPVGSRPVGGGSVGSVRRVTLADGRTVAVKEGSAGLAIEGRMLRYLARHTALPVPEVLHADDRLLVTAWIETEGGLDAAAETDAGALLAALHDVTADAFGFACDTPIGGLRQPNPWTRCWVAFFRDHRLLAMARQALTAGRLPAATMARIERLAGRLERWIEEPAAPSLIHGDLWAGNVLCRHGRIAGVVDPALAFADPEIELAFATLFASFGEPFFASYREHRPLRPGFFEECRDLYNLYPLLVHVRLFGGAYLGAVERTLARFGS